MTTSQVFSQGVQIGSTQTPYTYFTVGGELTASSPSTTPSNVDLFIGKTLDELKFRSLIAGPNIVITEGSPTLQDITISASGGGGGTPIGNVGGGVEVFKGVNLGVSELRSLTSDNSGISISQRATVIGFSNTLTGVNQGPGVTLFIDKVANTLNFKSLLPGTNTSFVDTLNSVTINSIQPPVPIQALTNEGPGAQIYDGLSGSTAILRTLVGNVSGIGVQQNTDNIAISNTLTAQNIGPGIGVFNSKSGDILQLKSLVAGPGILLTATGVDISIEATATAPIQSIVNIGGGDEVFDQVFANTARFRTLMGNSNGIAITQTSQELVFSNTLDGGNNGPGIGVYNGKVANALQFKSILAGAGITLTDAGTHITVASTGSGSTVEALTNVGSGVGVYQSLVGNTAQLRSILGSISGIVVSQTTNDLVISNTVTGSNIGAGLGLFNGKTAETLEFKSLVAGSGIILSTAGPQVQIEAVPTTPSWLYTADLVGSTLSPNSAFPGSGPANVVFPLPYSSTEGIGIKFIFDATKGALRAGSVSGAQWNDASRGVRSVAFGNNNTASGIYSGVLSGNGNSAVGIGSAVLGGEACGVSGVYSAVLCGNSNIVSAQHSSVICGFNNLCSAIRSTVTAGQNMINSEIDTMLAANIRVGSTIAFSGNQFYPSASGTTQISDTTSHMYIRSDQLGAGTVSIQLPTGPRSGQLLVIRDISTSFGVPSNISITSLTTNIVAVGGDGSQTGAIVVPLGGQVTLIYQTMPAMGAITSRSLWVVQTVEQPAPSVISSSLITTGIGTFPVYSFTLPLGKTFSTTLHATVSTSLGTGSWRGYQDVLISNIGGSIIISNGGLTRQALGAIANNNVSIAASNPTGTSIVITLSSTIANILIGYVRFTPEYI